MRDKPTISKWYQFVAGGTVYQLRRIGNEIEIHIDSVNPNYKISIKRILKIAKKLKMGNFVFNKSILPSNAKLGNIYFLYETDEHYKEKLYKNYFHKLYLIARKRPLFIFRVRRTTGWWQSKPASVLRPELKQKVVRGRIPVLENR